MEPQSQLAGAPWGGATPGVEPDAFDESQPVPASTITLVAGATFTICGPDGDLDGSGVAGLFVGDTRICSRLVLSIDGDGVEPLTLAARSPSSATFVGRTFDKRLLVFRDLWVGQGMRIDLRIRNLAREVRPVTVRLSVEADLAELFAVKKGEAPAVETPCTAEGGELRFDGDGRRRGLIVHTTGEARTDDGCAIVWQAELQPRQTWTACVELRALRGGEEVSPTYPCGQAPELTPTTTSRLGWRRRLPQLATDVPGLVRAFSRTGEDLGALQLTDPDHPEDLLVAAGAPWYMTLFGRDSILTSWMALLLDPTLGLGTARSLARMQGLRDVAENDEQPGRILHEIRFSRGPSLALADGDIYYGSADVTPLFVMLVHELWRWGTQLDELADLLPAVDAALAWMAGPSDADGDGYIEYAPSTSRSLVNQGWKDSFDGIASADGALPQAPIALAEVQGYAYAAWRAGAALAAARGDSATAAARDARATALQAAFERDFWVPERDAYALALDANKQQVDAVASNMGHLLWAGILHDREHAAAVARWLTSPELFTGWGVRTLASSMARYNPLSYHNGSVWPHDTAICIAGLRRAGFADEALLLARGLLAAAGAVGGRLPELFAGITTTEALAPVPYPASCSPQAWAAAAPLLIVRALLGLEPDVPGGTIALDPVLPDGAATLRLVGLPLGGERVTIDVAGDDLAVSGLPAGVEVVGPV